jgi:hypothetical protein
MTASDDAAQAAQAALGDWPARLRGAVETTLGRRATRTAAHAEFAERRRHGLGARHRQKLAHTGRRNTVDTPTELHADISHLDPDQRGALARMLATAARNTTAQPVAAVLADLATQAANNRRSQP